MGYTTVFGGELLFPSQTSYLRIDTAVDVALQWPIEQQIEGVDVVADFLDVNATAPVLNIDMPDARRASTGNKTTVNNIGSNDFTVRDATGGTIQQILQGDQWVLVLTDNTTEAGVWSAFQLGAATTFASASALAGAGLQADGFGLLEQIIDSDVEAATPVTVVDGDRAKCLVYTGGAGTANLPSAGAVFNNWFFMLRNSGSGTLNVLPPSGQIDGGASINLDPNDSAFFFTDGTDYFTIGLSSGSTIAFDFVSIAIPGSGDFVLSGANLNRISYRFTGALTGNRRVVVPNTTQQYWVDNQTSGAFTLEIDTAAGAGILVPQGQSVIVYCDATDVINATSSTSVAFPITIGQGGTGATTVGGAQINLQVPPDSRLLTAGEGMLGGGDLTADRTFDFDLASIGAAAPAVGDFLAFQDIDNADVNAKATIADIVALAELIVEDEGVPLATAATILDFVGGFVTASGAAAEKTITIGAPLILLDGEEIQFGTGNDIQMAFDGGVALELLSTLPGGQAFVLNSSGTAATLEIEMRNSTAGCRLEIEGVTGNIFFSYTTSLGVRTNRLWSGNLADGQLGLFFGDAFVANTATSAGSYPHFDDGGFEVNNSSTGNGQSRALTWYDQHFACSDQNLSRNLVGATPVEDPDLVSDDGGAPTLRQGFYKLEMWMVLQGQDTTTDFIFDFEGTNLGFLSYSWEAESADGTPFSRGASGLVAADQTVDLGSTVGEEVFLRIRGQFFINSNGGDINFRWAPSANVIDDVTRQQGAYMGIAATRIG